jgi:hypothetical protein
MLLLPATNEIVVKYGYSYSEEVIVSLTETDSTLRRIIVKEKVVYFCFFAVLVEPTMRRLVG